MRFEHFAPLREVELDPASRTARVVVMTEGLGNLRDKNFYTADAVESAAKVFSGKQFFVDHPSAREEEDRPERSVRDLGGYFYDTELGAVRDPESGERLRACFAKLKFADSEPGRLAYDQMREALEYQRRFPDSKDVYAGLSINGGGVSHPGTLRGMEVNMVTEIQEAFSADIVTKPARGGRFVALMREASRTAAWKRRRAREARAGRRAGMATVVVDPKARKGVREARRAVRDLRAAIEAKKGEQIQSALAALSEALKRVDKAAGDHKDLKEVVVAATGHLGKLAKLREQGDDDAHLDAPTLIADIKDDVDRLDDLVQPAAGDEEPPEGESEMERRRRTGEMERRRHTGEGEDEHEIEMRAAEDEDEDEARASEDEDEDEDEARYGMRSDEDEDEDEAGEPRAMQYSCASCGETNRVLPPKGFKLARMGEMRMGESARGADGLEATVRRLRHTLESKERRFVTHNRETRKLLRENTELRARLLAQERLDQARKALREAGVPPDIMKPKELLPFEPDQWPALVKAAKRVKTQEGTLLRGGAGPRGGGGGDDGRDTGRGGDAKTTFREAYQKPKDVLGI